MQLKQGYKAKTKLVSSYAWDTTIAFLQKVNSDYGSSSEEGNYTNTTFSYTDITGASANKGTVIQQVLVPTGQTTPVCNIYDMGGNVWEWTTESCSYHDGILTFYVEAVTAAVSLISSRLVALTIQASDPRLPVVSGSLYLCRPDPWMLEL